MTLTLENLLLQRGDLTISCDLQLPSGKLIALLGPSGCGKTSLLRTVSGLSPPEGGRIFLGGEDITHRDPRFRGVGMVFQDYALFTHMTVEKNIRYGMSQRGEEARRRCAELLKMVDLEGFQGRSVTTLSGGERQRVALARALGAQPKLLLLDEPLNALDARLRRLLGRQIRKVQKETGLTTLYVTHDQEEALALADWVLLMRRGEILQEGPPQDLYQRPQSSFSADFLGLANLVPPGVLNLGSLPPLDGPRKEGILFFRPENLFLLASGEPLPPETFSGEGILSYREFSGPGFYGEIRLREGGLLKIQKKTLPPEGERVHWYLRKGDCSLL